MIEKYIDIYLNSALSKIEKCNSFDLNVELKKRDQVNFFEYLTGKGILSSSTYLN